MEKIILAGGNGFIGKQLQSYFESNNFEVIVLSRSETSGQMVLWDGKNVDKWADTLENALAVINLSGFSVNSRHSIANKALILNSRVESTRAIGNAIKACNNPPKHWINCSGIDIYAELYGIFSAHKESSVILGSDFLSQVVRKWEEEFFSFKSDKYLQTALRIPLVLGKDGGAFPVLSGLAKKGLCGKQGSGNQWVSWVHITDLVQIFHFIIQNKLTGIVNATAPEPILNKEFNSILAKKYRPLITIPQPEWMLKAGAVFLGTEASLILKSQKVVPERLLQHGFTYGFPTFESALNNLY